MNLPLLKVDAIETAYGTSQVLFGVSLEVHEGEFVTLIGRNGMGKTTTVKTIMGMLQPLRGSVTMAGAAMQGQPSYRVAARHSVEPRGQNATLYQENGSDRPHDFARGGRRPVRECYRTSTFRNFTMPAPY